jgi:myo-inositol-1(or 4)-monophosphatase
MYEERLAFIKHLAAAAGKLTLEGFGHSHQIPKEGRDGYDIATEYDLRTEDLVKRWIGDTFGEPVLGEEEGLSGDRQMARHHLWIVDPIDGTFNYQRGLPWYGVSIAYCAEQVPVCGAIMLPAMDQLFFAARGSGAFLAEGQGSCPAPIRVSQERELARLILGLAGKGVYRLLAACDQEGIPRRSLRYSMAAVVDLAYVAAGRMDAHCHTQLNLWDCAAADILLREAGGPAPSDYGGTPIFPEYVGRAIAGDDAQGFTYVAVSSPAVLDEPLKRILTAAGYLPPGRGDAQVG